MDSWSEAEALYRNVAVGWTVHRTYLMQLILVKLSSLCPVLQLQVQVTGKQERPERQTKTTVSPHKAQNWIQTDQQTDRDRQPYRQAGTQTRQEQTNSWWHLIPNHLLICCQTLFTKHIHHPLSFQLSWLLSHQCSWCHVCILTSQHHTTSPVSVLHNNSLVSIVCAQLINQRHVCVTHQSVATVPVFSNIKVTVHGSLPRGAALKLKSRIARVCTVIRRLWLQQPVIKTVWTVLFYIHAFTLFVEELAEAGNFASSQ